MKQNNLLSQKSHIDERWRRQREINDKITFQKALDTWDLILATLNYINREDVCFQKREYD